ncbi:flagellin [Histidinibacterium lentulum]|uniref:Flagellin n=1 Tax=Histidinibacterium lentulum TaxID=2480588 RepID=A0A3N2R7F9_9RHOB|nr:flagellin [Histidinibacterium lentulum]ROU03256.1 flagellin [Histidinibacterium lentulum]
MSSILTNNGAMVALQTLKSINRNLTDTQNLISTGKAIGSAKDNSAVWAISKVMESDVKGFKAISESLALGESTVAVARTAAETTTDLLTQMKEKIVGAQEQNVDREKLQADIKALSDQISSVVGAAQFNGLSLLSGTDNVNVLSSLDRAPDGSVTASQIAVGRQDLTFDAGAFGTGTPLTANATTTLGGNLAANGTGGAFSNGANLAAITVAGTAGNAQTYTMQIAGTTVNYTTDATGTVDEIAAGFQAAINAAGIEGITATSAAAVLTISSTSKFDDVEINTGTTSGGGATFAIQSNGVTSAPATASSGTIQSRASEIAFSAAAAVQNGDGYRVTIGGQNYDYVAGRGESMEDVARGLKTVIDGAGLTNIETRVSQDPATGQWRLQIDNDGTALSLTTTGAAGGTATGGLVGVDKIDVTTDAGVASALANIETWIDTAIESAAAFGSIQGRIETQSEFISKLTDTLKSGIGSLVDADMEEASARLQALQVQQQLGTQALSIANQAPQSILSLFR